ncbi:MAG: hypothetical protein HYY61_02820 [Deltaproteobacteria bacterium]|nr:hypothetical protein [Deltaproteobacteria bacterium]
MMKRHLKSSLPALAEKALKEAVKEVVKENKKAGLPLIVWKDGKVVKIPSSKLKKTGS